MEIIFEFLSSLLFEGCFEIIENKNINIWIRRIVLGIVSIFYVGLIIILILSMIKIENIVIRMLFSTGIILFLVLLVKLWLKVYRNKAI